MELFWGNGYRIQGQNHVALLQGSEISAVKSRKPKIHYYSATILLLFLKSARIAELKLGNSDFDLKIRNLKL